MATSRDERRRAWAPLWEPTQLSAVRVLAGLRDRVLLRTEHRLPKWGFRLADDLAAQLQPKPVVFKAKRPGEITLGQEVVAFDGEVLFAPDGYGPDPFRGRRDAVPDPLIWMKFAIRSCHTETWRLRIIGVTRFTGSRYGPADALIVRRRLADALSGPGWDEITPGMMLSPRCFYCGRALTDPASRARLVGPECAGDSSTSVPGLTSVTPAPESADPVADSLARATLAGDFTAARALADRLMEQDVAAVAR